MSEREVIARTAGQRIIDECEWHPTSWVNDLADAIDAERESYATQRVIDKLEWCAKVAKIDIEGHAPSIFRAEAAELLRARSTPPARAVAGEGE